MNQLKHVKKHRYIKPQIKITAIAVLLLIATITLIQTTQTEQYKTNKQIQQLEQLHLENNCQYRGNTYCLKISRQLDQLRSK